MRLFPARLTGLCASAESQHCCCRNPRRSRHCVHAGSKKSIGRSPSSQTGIHATREGRQDQVNTRSHPFHPQYPTRCSTPLTPHRSRCIFTFEYWRLSFLPPLCVGFSCLTISCMGDTDNAEKILMSLINAAKTANAMDQLGSQVAYLQQV